MTVVHETLSQVRLIVKGNVKNEANPEGLLTRDEAKYLMCLELKHVEFEQLFKQDEAHWAENLLMVRKQAEEIKAQA